MREEKRKVRIAVVGLGKMGLLHACILNVLPNVRLEAVCDKSSLIRKVSRKLLGGIRFVDGVQDLACLDLDAIYITTPIPSHFAVARTIYSSRIAFNLFIEKTLASNSVQAQELCELARNFGGVNMVGYMKRFSVTFNKAKQLLDHTVLGSLSSFHAHAYSSDFAIASKGSNISRARGGVLSDLGSHVVDLALWFFQNLRVESARVTLLGAMSSEDAVKFNVRGNDGLEGSFDVSWCMKEYRMPEFSLTIEGDKGRIAVSDDEVSLETADREIQRWYRHDLGDNVDFLLGDPEYFREDKCFVTSVLDGRKCEPDFATASKVDEIIEQVRGRIGTK